MQKYLLKSLIVAAAAYFVPTNKLSNDNVLYIALAAGLGFYLLDVFMANQYRNLKENDERILEGLNTGATVGIIIGVILLIGVVGWLLFNKWGSSSKAPEEWSRIM